jgi:uncharacterized membrane protein (UPF0182 family)
MRPRRLPLLIILAVAVLLGLPSSAVFYTDWLWFREMHAEQVFLRTLNAEFAVFAVTFSVAFLFLYANFRIARGALRLPQVVFGAGADGRPIVVQTRHVSRLAVPVSLVIAIILGYAASSDWLTYWNYLHAVPFGQADPLFHRDVAFYVFQLPVYDLVRGQALVLAVLAIGGSGLLYVASGSFVFEPRFGVALWPRPKLAPTARLHLGLLIALLFALMAWGAWLDMPRLLLAPGTLVFGASYTDVHAGLPFLKITLAVLVVSCGLALSHGIGRRGWPVPVAVGLYLLVMAAGGIYSGIVQNFIVTPNERDKEQPFILNNIAATRRAYALDRVEERELTGDAALTPQDIANNAETIENVRLWDHEELLKTFAQIQEIRTYYDFNSVDNDRYLINGRYRQVMLSAREMNTDNLQNPSWVKERLTFTHGYGLTLGPVNQVTTGGLPVLFIKDLPPVSPVPNVNIPVTEPGIYFGEKSSNYALVNTQEPEFDYPRATGDDSVTTFYKGSGGVPVGGFWRRLLFSLRFSTTNILVTPQIKGDSRILFHRKITDRVSTIAPFLQLDTDPYLVISEGRLFWIQDAYTTTANYPYSMPVADVNYIRNSVKITIDAYNGTTAFYLAEPSDPIALTLANIFPGLFQPIDAMPDSLRQHVRYPEKIFAMQSAVYATYHMTNPQVFYNKEDQWQVPVLDSGQSTTPMQPYYTVMKLPGEQHTEFIQMLPFTPRLKSNLSAWMVARSDKPHYGHMLVFQYPKQSFVQGPQQIVSRINQDQLISPQITLWDQQGSKVIQGTLLVIPIEKSLLYVRPLYLQSSDGLIPVLARVIVAYQTKIVMAETLTQGLVQIFGRSIEASLPVDRFESNVLPVVPASSGVPGVPGVPGVSGIPAVGTGADQTVVGLAAQASDHYDRMTKAARDGDWALFGDEQKKLGDILAKMQKIKK